MTEFEVEIEEIQEMPKRIDPTKLDFVFGSFTKNEKPVERLLSTYDTNFFEKNIEFDESNENKKKK